MGTEPPGRPRAKLLLAFAAIYVLWGSTYLAIRVAVETLPPFLMAGTRFLVAGAVLYAYCSRAGLPRATARQWRNAAIASVPLFVLGNGGVTWAEQEVPSGAASLVIATLPVWLLLLDWGYGGRAGPRLAGLLGIGLGLAGVAVLTAPGGIDPAGAGALLLAAVAWAVGSLLNRYADLPASAVRTAAMQMLVGGAVMVALGLAAGGGGRLDPHAVTGGSAAAWVYLAAVAVVALPAYNWLLTATSPALVGTYAFVNPVVAVLLGWAAAGEALSERTAGAAALVVLGVMLLVLTRRRGYDGACPPAQENRTVTPTTADADTPRTSASGYDLTPPPAEELERLAAALTPEERRVILDQGTEPPFCGGLLANKEAGVYGCRLCGLPLFRSAAKFESGTGWPSFSEAFDPDHVAVRRDTSHGMVRDEIVCARCGGHLGHVFPDGPRPTGLRYCLNSVALRFVADGTKFER